MSYLTWLRAPENRTTALALGAAATGVLVWGFWSVSKATEEAEKVQKKRQALKRGVSKAVKKSKGYLMCPADTGVVPPDLSTLAKGDFVIIQLSSKDDTFRESTWARVLSISPGGQELYIQIQGEYLEGGIKPIQSEQHGYHLSDRMIIPRECVFDMLHIHSKMQGFVACGPSLLMFKDSEGKPLYTPKDTSEVEPNYVVEVIVADPSNAWHEPLYVLVTNISQTKQVITGVVSEEPDMTDKHGLELYSKLSFGRDCVVDIKEPWLKKLQD